MLGFHYNFFALMIVFTFTLTCFIIPLFRLGSISNGFSATESREVSLNENVYDFSVDYNCIDKSDIFNIHNYLMKKNNTK